MKNAKIKTTTSFNEKHDSVYPVEEKKKSLNIRVEGNCLIYDEYLCFYEQARLEIKKFIDDFNKNYMFEDHRDIELRIKEWKRVKIGSDDYLFGEHYIEFENEEVALLAKMIITNYVN